MCEEPDPDRDTAVREAGLGNAGADFGIWKNFKKVFKCPIVLLAHGGHEHFVCPWRVRRLGLGAGVGNFGVRGDDIQRFKKGAESGDVISCTSAKNLFSTGLECFA